MDSALRAEERPGLSIQPFRTAILKLFQSMPLGRLRLTEPDGNELIFGNGSDPEAQIRLRSFDFFRKCAMSGDIGFGESFVDGDWDSGNLRAVISWFLANLNDCPAISGSSKNKLFLSAFNFSNRFLHALRGNSFSGSRKNIRAHYDLSNDFFKSFLDQTMTYSCAYFKHQEQSLEEAQIEKYDQLCRKLRLEPTDQVLEIGSGWGGFALHAAKTYGCKITTVTISEEQHKFVKDLIREEGLESRIEIRMQDYRQITGAYDKIVSIEMLEAVGDKYFETYFDTCHKVLKKNGLLALQMITCPDSRYAQLRDNVDWIQKHIFPGSLLPSIARVQEALRKTGDLQLHDLEDMGAFYSETLKRWHENFNRSLDQISEIGFDEAFVRKWNYYFQYCEAAFRARNISVVQAVYARPNNSTI